MIFIRRAWSVHGLIKDIRQIINRSFCTITPKLSIKIKAQTHHFNHLGDFYKKNNIYKGLKGSSPVFNASFRRD
jgi:hypothetical protein